MRTRRRAGRYIFALVTLVFMVAAIKFLAPTSSPHTVKLGAMLDFYHNHEFGCLWLQRDAALCMKEEGVGRWVVTRKNLKLQTEQKYIALSECVSSTKGSPGFYSYLTSNPDGLTWSNPVPFPGMWFYCRLDGSQCIAFPRNMPFPHIYVDSTHYISLPIQRKTRQNYVYNNAIIFDGHRETILPISPEIPYRSDNVMISPQGYILTHSWPGFWMHYPFITIQWYKAGKAFVPFKQYSIRIPGSMDVCDVKFSPSGKQVAFVLAQDHSNPPLLANLYQYIPQLRPTGQDFSLWAVDIDGSHMRCVDEHLLIARSASKQDKSPFEVIGSIQWILDESGIVFRRNGSVYEVNL